MKLVDSLNPATQAENIKKLNAGLEAVDAKTPKDYSTTETATGQKWVDGKEIYFILVSGSLDTLASGVPTNIADLTVDNIVKMLGTIKNDGYIRTAPYYVTSNNNISVNYNISTSKLYLYATSSITSKLYYNIGVYYTKPDPVPDTREDDTPEEPEEKKTTKKKTTK